MYSTKAFVAFLTAVCMAALSVLWAPGAMAIDTWSDGFEDYEPGTGINGQGTWETWDQVTDPIYDGTVSDMVAASGNNSLLVNGSCDVVRLFEGIDSGVWVIEAKVYLPADQSGNLYFILLNRYVHGGENPKNWSVQLRMSNNTGLIENLGGSIANGGGSAEIIPDEWHAISVQMDFDSNTHSVYFNGQPLRVNSVWAGGDNHQVALGALDIYSESSSESYFDDIAVYQVCVPAQRTVETGRTMPVLGIESPLYREGDLLRAAIALSGSGAAGCDPLPDVTVTEVLPEGWTAQNISAGGTFADGRITWSVPGAQIGTEDLTYEASGPVSGTEVPIMGWVVEGDSAGELPLAGESIVTENALAPNGDILAWLFLGPYMTFGTSTTTNAAALRGDYLTDGGDITEADIMPAAGDEVATDYSRAASNGLAAGSGPGINPDGVPRWFAWRGVGVQVDFDNTLLFGAVDNVMCYAVCYLCAEDDMPATLYAGSDDAIQILVNGEEVWNNPVERAWPGLVDMVPIELVAGRNRLMVKIFETGGGWNFGVRITDWGGLDPVEGVRFTLDPAGCGDEPPREVFRRGDVNADGSLNIADAIALLGHLFGGEPAPVCPDAADANDDGQLNIADAIAVLGHLFGGAGDLPAPFGACGVDPTEDTLGPCNYPPDRC